MSENDSEVPKNYQNLKKTPGDLEEKPATVPVNSALFMMLEKIIGKQNEQEKFNKENQQKLLEKFESMQSQLNKLEKQINPTEELVENITETVDEKPDEQEQQQPIVPLVSKRFVLRHTFKNVAKMIEEERKYSRFEDYFGVKWCISIGRKGTSMCTYLHIDRSEKAENWSVEVDHEIKVINPDGKHFSLSLSHCYEKNIGRGWSNFLKLEDIEKDYLVDGELKVEAHVKILKMTGVYKGDLRTFDDPECSDVVLIVDSHKFYVSKLTLVAHSPYFKALFLGMFGESKKSEITLTGINSDDFQKYLEVVYGEYAIDEYTVEGILLIADMYDTPIVVRKCEEFLIEKSEKMLKKKLQMAVRYNLKKLKKNCLSEIKTMDDIRSVTPDDIQDMDPSMVAVLFKKSLALN